MKQIKQFHGIFPAFYACYDEQGAISPERTGALASFYLEKGVAGLYVCGSSGEAIYHSVAERKASLEATMAAVGGKMTIIAHIAAARTADSIELARHAEALGVDAIAAIPGIYYSLNDTMVERYWLDLLDATHSVDLFIYNIPQTTQYSLSVPLLKKMLQTGRVIGIKNSSTQVLDMMTYRRATHDQFVIFNGADRQYLAGRVMGANGGIGGTYGFMPELFLRLEAHIQQQNIKEAHRLQTQICALIDRVDGFPSLIAAAKGLLELRGLETGGVRAPFLPLRASDQAALQSVYADLMSLIGE